MENVFNPNLSRIRYFKNGKVSFFYKNKVVGKMMLLDTDQPAAYISHLSVTPKWRNKRIGSYFLCMVFAHLRDNTKCNAVGLHCAMDNVNALRFYKRYGLFIAHTTTRHEPLQHYFLARLLW